MEKSSKKNSLVKWIIIVLALVVFIIGIFAWYYKIKKPHDKAVIEFNSAANKVTELNSNLEQEISDAQSLLDSGEPPYDETTINDLTLAIADANASKRKIPEVPKKTDEIQKATSLLLEPLDYSSAITNIKEKKTALENSILQLKQITNPSGDFVIQRLQGINGISACQAVTEDHDLNGLLNKQGGYTATIYFSSPLIDQSQVYGNDIVDKGNDGGGAVEVYANQEDAAKRDAYLSSFDGAGVLNPGSHTVLGTLVLRTSSRLTATQQKDLTQKIADKLLELQ
ncbi:EbhA [Faecalicatena sp. AGMB00832]|uniref:EbhA n=1 Tax=Faecalicatena faecalis TaxID=2726362 RepID=A0ABS6D3I3_9FIRM|nr:EbhA [Faecalicatena faecalis]MBU3876138.1 EbhA [Faecalicatena faecalis]